MGSFGHRRATALVALLVLVSEITFVALAAGVAGACSMPGRTFTFKGTLIETYDSIAHFQIDELVDVIAPDQLPTSRFAIPDTGDTVDVAYPADDVGWLGPGQSYAVAVTLGSDSWASGVYTPGEGSCSVNGTTWADGSPINTALWTRHGIRTLPGLGLVAVILGLAVLITWKAGRDSNG